MPTTVDSCSVCGIFHRYANKSQPSDYKELIHLIIEMRENMKISLMYASLPLEEVYINNMWGNDIMSHKFKCNKCGKAFELGCDSYHGRFSISYDKE